MLFQRILLTNILALTAMIAPIAPSFANPTTPIPPNEQLVTIDTELKALYAELKTYRKLSAAEELEAQRYFRNNPSEYLELVQRDESDANRIEEIKEKITTLQKKKQEIQQAAHK